MAFPFYIDPYKSVSPGAVVQLRTLCETSEFSVGKIYAFHLLASIAAGNTPAGEATVKYVKSFLQNEFSFVQTMANS